MVPNQKGSGPLDTLGFGFYANGMPFQAQDTFPASDSLSIPFISYFTSNFFVDTPHMLGAFLTGTVGDTFNYALNLPIYATPREPLVPGTYVLVPATVTLYPWLRMKGSFITANFVTSTPQKWDLFVSDTVIISNVDNGYADGVFSAVLTTDAAWEQPDTVIITVGTFKHLQVVENP